MLKITINSVQTPIKTNLADPRLVTGSVFTFGEHETYRFILLQRPTVSNQDARYSYINEQGDVGSLPNGIDPVKYTVYWSPWLTGSIDFNSERLQT